MPISLPFSGSLDAVKAAATSLLKHVSHRSPAGKLKLALEAAPDSEVSEVDSAVSGVRKSVVNVKVPGIELKLDVYSKKYSLSDDISVEMKVLSDEIRTWMCRTWSIHIPELASMDAEPLTLDLVRIRRHENGGKVFETRRQGASRFLDWQISEAVCDKIINQTTFYVLANSFWQELDDSQPVTGQDPAFLRKYASVLKEFEGIRGRGVARLLVLQNPGDGDLQLEKLRLVWGYLKSKNACSHKNPEAALEGVYRSNAQFRAAMETRRTGDWPWRRTAVFDPPGESFGRLLEDEEEQEEPVSATGS